MQSKLANWLRRLANWLHPEFPEVEVLMPLARRTVAVTESMAKAGSIKWLIAMKAMEGKTGAKRRHINAAIDRAVLERGD